MLEDADGRQLASAATPIGQATVAVAEYRALVAGLHAVSEHGLAAVEVRTDSRLVVAQMTGDGAGQEPAGRAASRRGP